jgi:hypothetical protein
MPESEVASKYAQAFVASAGEVSPVFERKARGILEDNGITDLQDADWLPMAAFTAALADVEDEVGAMTLTEGGKEMAKVNDLSASVDSIDAALESLNDSHQRAHRNGSQSDWGSYGFDRLDDTRVRMSCSDDYPYPYPLAKGVFEGIVRQFAGTDVSLTTREVEGSDLTFDEGYAYDITW